MDVMIGEYLELAEKYENEMSVVKPHLFKMGY